MRMTWNNNFANMNKEKKITGFYFIGPFDQFVCILCTMQNLTIDVIRKKYQLSTATIDKERSGNVTVTLLYQSQFITVTRLVKCITMSVSVKKSTHDINQ